MKADQLPIEKRIASLADLAIKCGKKEACENSFGYSLETKLKGERVELFYHEGKIDLNFYMDSKCGTIHIDNLRQIRNFSNYEKLDNLNKATRILEENAYNFCKNPNIC